MFAGIIVLLIVSDIVLTDSLTHALTHCIFTCIVISKLCRITNDKVDVKYYDRLSPLKVTPAAIGDITNVAPGDCVIDFSRKAL